MNFGEQVEQLLYSNIAFIDDDLVPACEAVRNRLNDGHFTHVLVRLNFLVSVSVSLVGITFGGAGSKRTSLLIPKFMFAQQNLPMSKSNNNLYISIHTTPVIMAVVVATAGMMWPIKLK